MKPARARHEREWTNARPILHQRPSSQAAVRRGRELAAGLTIYRVCGCCLWQYTAIRGRKSRGSWSGLSVLLEMGKLIQALKAKVLKKLRGRAVEEGTPYGVGAADPVN